MRFLHKFQCSILILICGALIHTMCGKRESNQLSTDTNDSPATELEIINLTDEIQSMIDIQLATVERNSIHIIVTATGKVEAHPNRIALVGPIVPGRVSKLHVNIGDPVEKDGNLIEIESVEFGNAKSEYFTAKTNYEFAKANHARLNKLYAKNIGSQKELLRADGEFKKTQSIFFAAEKQLHLMGLSEDDIKLLPNETHDIDISVNLRSPIKGTVIERNAILGEQVNSESVLFKVVDMNKMCVRANIYETDIAKIHVGQKVKVSVPAYPEEVFDGTVKYINSQFNDETRTVPAHIEVTNKNNRLKIGMFANTSIFTEEKRAGLTVPKNAILEDDKDIIIFVKEQDGFRRRTITTGASYLGNIEVLAGLNEGEVVVTNGNFQLMSELHGKSYGAEHSH